jgi:hypothetical protein
MADFKAALGALVQYLQSMCGKRGNQNTCRHPQKNIDNLGDNGLWFDSGLADIK